MRSNLFKSSKKDSRIRTGFIKPRNSLIGPGKKKNFFAEEKKSSSFANASKKLRKSLRKAYKPSLILFLVGCFVALNAFLLFEASQFNSNLLERNFANLKSNNCMEYVNSGNQLSTALLIEKSPTNPINRAKVVITQGKEIMRIVDITNQEFNIDKNGRKGTLKDYFNLNKVYIEEKEIISNLPYVLKEQLYIKVDYIYYSDSKLSAQEFNGLIQTNYIAKWFKKDLPQGQIALYSNVCKKTLVASLEVLFNQKYKQQTELVGVNSFDPVKFFDLNQLKKEQLRIQIINKSGVEQVGNFYATFFRKYGINIVNNAYVTTESVPTTTVSITNSSQSTSFTLQHLLRLLAMEKYSVVEDNQQISDISIILGQDSVPK